MPLEELERWLQESRPSGIPSANQHVNAGTGYLAAIVAGHSVDQPALTGSVRCSPSTPMHSTPRRHGRSSRRSQPSGRHPQNDIQQHPLDRPRHRFRADAPGASRMANVDRAGPLVPGISRRHGWPRLSGLGAAPRQPATITTHGLLLPILLPLRRRFRGIPCSGRPGKGRETKEFPAQRPQRYSGGRRGHAPITGLADPLTVPVLADPTGPRGSLMPVYCW